ncbi:cobalamin biosynthesis protein CobD [Variovorax sp. PCZ-1]|nr:adenosylcobinamide-phosphate synthase CbiB [Variovorax sp. PCZ-1]MBS7807008.1 cobalamin biosynthesis protein CobD [Variovorax sp. PCZ-1]
MVLCGALCVALLLDHVWGEPPVRWHPVVWMGRYLHAAAGWFAPVQDNAPETKRVFWQGALYWSVGALVVCTIFVLIEHLALQLPWALAAILLGLALKPLLSMAMLCNEVAAVEEALSLSLQLGRERLSRLVSRPTQDLSETQVREAAIETLAENLNDSVVSPLLWFVIGGLPAAALYRFANTADAMWGYPGMHGGRDWQWAGKWAARADDVLSWPGARLTALLVWCWHAKAFSWETLREQARQTPSPNSGWPMAAFALTLGVQLSKPGAYTLHPGGQVVQRRHLAAAISLARKVLFAGVLIALAAIFLVAMLRQQ